MADSARDGIKAIVPRQAMTPACRKIWDYYERVPGAPLYHCEFANGYFFTLERWKREGMSQDVPMAELFGFDDPAWTDLWGAGWGNLPFSPGFEEAVLEDRGDTQVVSDGLGRKVLYFKHSRDGYMPEYLDHPVKDVRTWEEEVKWRLDPHAPELWRDLDETVATARANAATGFVTIQRAVGGYMYLRSLMGPVDLLYAFHDQPALIHDCMQTWFEFVDTVAAVHQRHITIDQFFIGEDICYNHGSLISPDMIREFLLPYYSQVLTNIRARQIDRSRHLYFQVDTDGLATPLIELYQSVGMDVMSPFEVASGCDVVEIGRRYPALRMNGGIDKRVLSSTPDAIDRHLAAILPAMRERGAYYPTCDHGVPLEVSYGNYLHYRRRCLELGG